MPEGERTGGHCAGIAEPEERIAPGHGDRKTEYNTYYIGSSRKASYERSALHRRERDKGERGQE